MRTRSIARRASVLLALGIGTALGVAAPAPESTAARSTPPGTTLDPGAALAAASWQPVHRSAAWADDVRMAPGTGGRLFVAIRGATSTRVAGFDARGGLLAGWPVSLTGWTDCWLGSVTVDNSVRLVCHNTAGLVRAFAFDRQGHRLAGWPVDVASAAGRLYTDYDAGDRSGDEPRIVGSRLVILLQRWDGGQALRLVRIAAGGSVTIGKPFQYPPMVETVQWSRALGADGTGFAVRTRFSTTSVSTQITAFGMAGPISGWPVGLAGRSSLPAVGPGGRVYIVQASTSRRAAWVRVYEHDGTRLLGWSPKLAVAATSDWNGAGGFNAAPPTVSTSGAAWLISDQGGTTAWALGPAGSVRSGWPYRSSAALTDQGRCDDGCTAGCGSLRVTPVVGPGDVIYLAQDPRSTAVGGRIVALGRDGNVRNGWPIALVRPGARFRSLAVAASGTLYSLAIEPERVFTRDGCTIRLSSATIVAFAPDGTVRYRRTVMEP